MKSVQFISNQRRECEQFLTIRTVDGPYQTIDLFVRDHQNITDDLLNTCVIRYRDTEKQSSPNLCVNCFRYNMQEAA